MTPVTLAGNMRRMPNDPQTRTVVTFTLGTKICLLIALLFVVASVYFYFVPITSVRTATGAVFGCGSAASPSTGNFADGTCSRIAESYKYRALAWLAGALVMAVVGLLFFGVDRRTEARVPRGRGAEGDALNAPTAGEPGSAAAAGDGATDQPVADAGSATTGSTASTGRSVGDDVEPVAAQSRSARHDD